MVIEYNDDIFDFAWEFWHVIEPDFLKCFLVFKIFLHLVSLPLEFMSMIKFKYANSDHIVEKYYFLNGRAVQYKAQMRTNHESFEMNHYSLLI